MSTCRSQYQTKFVPFVKVKNFANEVLGCGGKNTSDLP